MRTRRGLDRMVTFADAVVAIALTLLVLQLVDIPRTDPTSGVGAMLDQHLGQLSTFLLSFAVIARFWLAHHTLFERVGAYDRVVRGLTLAWLLSIVFLPFPTELVAVGYSQASAALYIGTLLMASLTHAGASAWVDAHPGLQCNTDDDGHVVPRPATSWITPALMAVALVVAVTVPGIGMWALLVLFLGIPLATLRARRARSRTRQGAVPI